MKTQGLLLTLFLLNVGRAIGPAPDPNVPFPFDPNLCPSAVFDYNITDVGTSFAYSWKAISTKGIRIPIANVKVYSNGELLQLNIEKGKTYQGIIPDTNEPVWVQEFALFHTPLEAGLFYWDFQLMNVNGDMGRGTVVFMVVSEPDTPYLYPIDKPRLTTIGTAQRLWQRARADAAKFDYDDLYWPTRPTRRLN